MVLSASYGSRLVIATAIFAHLLAIVHISLSIRVGRGRRSIVLRAAGARYLLSTGVVIPVGRFLTLRCLHQSRALGEFRRCARWWRVKTAKIVVFILARTKVAVISSSSIFRNRTFTSISEIRNWGAAHDLL